MEETYQLELLFKDEAGRSKKIVLANPRLGLVAEDVEAAMNGIEGANIFQSEHGDAYATSESARYVRRQVETIAAFA